MGRALADSGKHEAALQLFKEAYDIHQDPGYLYNLGIEYQALGRDVEALDAFDRFLKDAQKIPPEFVADANQQLRELHRRLGTFEIHCTQEGARIVIDGQDRGRTPDDRTVRVAPGVHRVAVVKDGFEPFTANVAVGAGARVAVEALLRVIPVPTSPIATGFGLAGPQQPSKPQGQGPSSAPAAAAGDAARFDTGTGELFGPERIGEASASPLSRTHLSASTGVGIWLGGVPNDPKPSAAFSLGAGHAITNLSQRADFRLGGRLGLTFLSEPESTDLFVSVLLNPMVTMSLIPDRLYAFGQMGLGALVLTGVKENSVLLDAEAGQVTGALSTFELRPGVGAGYSITRHFSVFLAPELVWSPRPSVYFRHVSITRLELSVGALMSL